MKKILFLTLVVSMISACGGSATTQVNSNTSTAAAPAAPRKDDLTVSSHSIDKKLPPAAPSSAPAGPGSGGSPMQKSVDVSGFTAAIEKAEKDYKAKPSDAAAKDALATAYFKRAFVLTDAAQYRAALGDFRKGLKLKPEDQEAKGMHDQIIGIFASIGREAPKEGEEPPPMPVSK
jgi:hypothetical protein